MIDFKKILDLAISKEWEKMVALNNPVLDTQQGFRQPDRAIVQRQVVPRQ